MDIIGLQEVESDPPGEGIDQLLYLASQTGLSAIAGPTLLTGRGRYGNALLARHPVREVRRIDLSFRCTEPRGALDVDLDVDGIAVRVIVTHLGLWPGERRWQIRRLVSQLGERETATLVVVGDVNEWNPVARPLRTLDQRLGRSRALRTFPSWRPLLPLDRIWVRPRSSLLELRVHATPLARLASDHLPLYATVAAAPQPDE